MLTRISVEMQLEELTEPQIFDEPKQLYTWRNQDGHVVDFLVLPVIAILPKTLCNSLNHANVICIKDGKFWWACHCAEKRC